MLDMIDRWFIQSPAEFFFLVPAFFQSVSKDNFLDGSVLQTCQVTRILQWMTKLCHVHHITLRLCHQDGKCVSPHMETVTTHDTITFSGLTYQNKRPRSWNRNVKIIVHSAILELLIKYYTVEKMIVRKWYISYICQHWNITLDSLRSFLLEKAEWRQGVKI